MIEQYLKWIEQLRIVYNKWSYYSLTGEYELAIVNGMGGSGIVGDYLASLTHIYGGLPVIVVKNHIVPKYIDDKTLVFIVSYSGNTLETIKFAEEVIEYTRSIVVVTSNGYLEKYAYHNNLLTLSIPKDYLPRTSLPYMLVSILSLLDNSGYTIVSKNTVYSTIGFLEKELSGIVETSNNIANYIYKYCRTLLLTTHSPLDPLAIRARNEFSENSKILTRIEIVPESMHNDIVGWENPFASEYVALTIRDPGNITGSRLVDFIEEIYSERNVPIYRLNLIGESFFTKLIHGSLVLGLASVYLAHMRRVDPVRTLFIEKYKSIVRDIYS